MCLTFMQPAALAAWAGRSAAPAQAPEGFAGFKLEACRVWSLVLRAWLWILESWQRALAT